MHLSTATATRINLTLFHMKSRRRSVYCGSPLRQSRILEKRDPALPIPPLVGSDLRADRGPIVTAAQRSGPTGPIPPLVGSAQEDAHPIKNPESFAQVTELQAIVNASE